MTQKINVQSLPIFSLAKQLETEDDIAIYLGLALEEDNSSESAHAMAVVDKTRELIILKKTSRQAFPGA